jgi:hypothetical protein
MSEKHGFLDALKHVAFEDEPAPPEKHTPPPAASSFAAPAFVSTPVDAAPSSTAYAPPTAYASIDAGVVPDNDSVYQTLLAKTDFESTTTAGTIHKFLDPLKAIPDTVMPTNVKFKTAVLQASAQAGLTEDGILGTFDTLKAKLQQEKDAFGGKGAAVRGSRSQRPAGSDSEDHRPNHPASAGVGSTVKRIGGCAGKIYPCAKPV